MHSNFRACFARLGLPLFLLAGQVTAAWGGTCTVSIQDLSPIPGATKNVGQEIKLNAALTGSYSVVTYNWDVQGEVIDDYNELEPGPFTITDHAEIAGPIAQFTGQMINYYWREQGQVPPNVRTVSLSVTADADTCNASAMFTVERNADLTPAGLSRQPEDFYAETNHGNRVLIEHANWHAANSNSAANFNGEEFFCFHRRLIDRFDGWRSTFGYPPIGIWDPKNPMPANDGTYSLGHANRVTSNPAIDISVTFPWFTIPGGANMPANRPACFTDPGVKMKLADFASLDQLGCAVSPSFHDDLHVTVGGSMGGVFNAPRDPNFWRWHNFLSDLAFNKWVSTVPNGVAVHTCALPPNGSEPCGGGGGGYGDFSHFTVSYDYDYTQGNPGGVKYKATDVKVNGKAAHLVTGSGTGPLTYSGYRPVGPGAVVVTVKDHRYKPAVGQTTYTRGDTYTYHYVGTPTGYDSDGDGVYDAPCWPNVGYDNCPNTYNPDQSDYDDNYRSDYHVGDACQTYTCGNGIQEPGEVCDDGNNVSGDGCRNDCRSTEYCGNGEIDGYEQCDDGNTDNNDGCKNDCTYNNCGDGYPNYGSYGAYGYGREDCDDGNYSYGDGCTPNCCREYQVGFPYAYPVPETAVDCLLRAMEVDLKYGRYDLKALRKVEKVVTKARAKLGVVGTEQCGKFRLAASLITKLPASIDKLVVKGLIPSSAGQALKDKAQALSPWLSYNAPGC